MEQCIFCKIVAREIPAQIVYEDDEVLAFKDLSPQAPIHILIIPKKHYANLLEISSQDNIVSRIIAVANKISVDLNIDQSGFRIVNNCKEDGGQTVNHVHFHLLGGRKLKWPPG